MGANTLTSSSTTVFDLNGGTLSAGSALVSVSGGTLSLGGPLVSDTGSTFTIADNFLQVIDSSTLTSTTKSPLITLSGSTVNVEDDFVRIDDNAQVTLSGSLLSAGSTLNIGTNVSKFADLLNIQKGGQLFTSSDEQLVLINGGTHTIKDRLFEATGTGTNFQPIKGSQASFIVNNITANNPIGALFKATNAADISVDNGIKIDTALFEATLPVIELVGSSSAQTKITSANTFMEISSANVVLKGPVIALDKGLITVTNGPLISVSSSMDVLGNVFKLFNGSTINVVNGPAIRVDGAESSFSATGALLNFDNTSGNTFIINNGLAFTTKNGINVSEGTSGSITIGIGQIINNPKGNTVTQNGAVIQTIGSGTVNIAGTGGGG